MHRVWGSLRNAAMLRSLLAFFTLLTTLLLLASCGKTAHLQGKALYVTHCNNCHLEEGQGIRQLIPPLAGADYLRDHPVEVVRGIRHGMQGPMVVNGVTYNHEMPGNIELTEFQIVNILNYVHTSWGNDVPLVTVEQVRGYLAE
ncbi:hypothetical protein LEM8419_01398 [Neolewinella maritima]|uniref:Cytochrome c domain-containing protein n=2 Tax=Neolewinella maritima TaxID=1383882 RepID=A0ABM9AZX4_9BACT|nr:hypothetical protein LEM8419_01398 [Neolewinella maritima]